MKDVNPIVRGNGIEKLKKAGIEVIQDVLTYECEKLNEVFIKNMTQNKVFVALKTATTLDGKIATKSGSSKWITSAKSREEVKKSVTDMTQYLQLHQLFSQIPRQWHIRKNLYLIENSKQT